MQSDIIDRFWNAPEEAFFTREEVASIRRCSVAKLEREAWQGEGIRHVKDGHRSLYRKADVVAYLTNPSRQAEPMKGAV